MKIQNKRKNIVFYLINSNHPTENHKSRGYMNISYLKVLVMIEFDTIFEPSDFRPWNASSRAEERNFTTQHVVQLKMRGLGDLGALSIERSLFAMSIQSQQTENTSLTSKYSRLCSRNN